MSSPSHTRVTLRDIAERLGCSKNTVSLALRDSPRISEETRERVRTAAADMGYIPDHAARKLATSRSRMIGVYTQSLGDAVRTTLVRSLIIELHRVGYFPVLGLAERREERWYESRWMQSFQALNVQAIAVVAENVHGQLPEPLSKLPLVLVHCHPDDRLACDYVALDRVEAVKSGLEHLVSRGYRRIGLAGAGGLLFVDAGIEYLHKREVTALRIDVGHGPPDTAGTAAWRQTLKLRPPPEALLFGDSEAAARFVALAHDAGTRIPEDLAVLSYDYYPSAALLRVPLSTIEQPISELAVCAAELVRRRAERPNAPYTHITLPHRIVDRGSA